jgi:hypothetical protein
MCVRYKEVYPQQFLTRPCSYVFGHQKMSGAPDPIPAPKIPTRHFLALKRNSKTPELFELFFSICLSIGDVLLSY